MRLSITVDPELLEEVQRLARVRTKREAIERALQDFVRHHRLRELQALAQAWKGDLLAALTIPLRSLGAIMR